MKIVQKEVKVNEREFLLACYDTSQSKSDFNSEYKMNGIVYYIEDIIDNNPRAIKNHFLELEDIRRQLNLTNINVFFEPTGGYEETLKQLAFKANYKVNYVSGEATRKARIIESNDDNKSDSKDKRIILTLAQMSKVLTCRNLKSGYSELRKLGGYYEDVSNLRMRLKTQISDIAKNLFPKQAVRSSFLYSATGAVIMEFYGFNPFRMTEYSYNTFIKRMKKRLSRVSEKVLKNIYRKAEAAVRVFTETDAYIHQEQLAWYYKEYERCTERKEKLNDQMCCLYRSLPEYEKFSQIEDVTDFMMARLVGETGPLSDFDCRAKIMRYAGLNLRVRESGKYKGERKISKKGRALLRKILYQMVFSCLIKKGNLYHNYFHTRKDAGIKGLVILTNIMRKTLKMLFGVFNSSLKFDIERVQTCEIEYIRLTG